MPITQDTITTVDGTCTVTVATPDGTGPWPAVVMFPDAGGLRPTFDQMAAQLAGFGYVVLVPDVYYRTPGWGPFDLNTVFTDHEQRKQLFELMGTLTPKIFAADAEAFFDYLAARPDVAGDKFGTTGYCMGGRASLIVATRVPERVAAALSFHGGRLAVEDDPDSPHLLADKITAVVYVGAAENDASFTTDDAKKLGVKQITGTFTTYFPGSAYRVNNIGKAARLINGTFLKPGETFSMNATLGKRTAAAGWMAGGGIEGGKIKTLLGGGISQATTTTFNAIFFAGLEDVYHKPHSLYFSRYPVGREATLDWQSVDMNFRNDSPYGVVLQAWTTGKVGQTGSVTVRVWSTKRYTIKASTPVRSNYRSPGATQYDDSPGCVAQSAMSGFDVRYKRLFYRDGKLIKSEPFFWRYNTLTPVVCGKKP